MTDAVHDLARRAAADPHYLAFALAEYAAREALDEAGLLAALGATPEALASTRLCRTPRPDPEGFRADIDRIAGKFGLNRDVLAKAARHGLVVADLRRAATESPADVAAFLAARDRDQ